jgi:hypothetical protein
MVALLLAEGSTWSAEPVGELAATVLANGDGARSLCARSLSLSGAPFTAERR